MTQHQGPWIHPTARIGQNVSIAPGAFVAEGACVEDGACVSPLAYIAANVRIGRSARISPGAVVLNDVPAFAIVEPQPSAIVGYESTVPNAPSSSRKGASTGLPGPQAIEVRGASWVDFPAYRDMRGSLVVCEHESDLPFQVRRSFVVHEVPNAKIRGEHAHRQCHQLLVCLHGSLHVMMDDGRTRQTVTLDSPARGLHLQPRIWGTQFGFSSGAVLFVYASELYDSDEYIRSYDEFLSEVSGCGPLGALP